ncbi:lipoyl synthase [Thermodesulfobacteriota bacterium]
MRIKKYPWLKQRLTPGSAHQDVKNLLNRHRLHTVCQEAQCPNLWECFSKKTATFMIMGSRCTRNCGFCAVSPGPSDPPDPDEPNRVAEAVHSLRLNYAVITSVTRDDLSDGGASLFARTVTAIRQKSPDVRVEVLIPDFQGSKTALKKVVDSRPDVLNHNVETVPRLYDTVRPEAVYRRSIDLMEQARALNPNIPTKSGIMLGLGEYSEEIHQTLLDLFGAGCRLLTLGQYLQPSGAHLSVVKYIPPEEFDQWREIALEMGFTKVASGPFVRSSYQARKLYGAVTI